MAVRYWFHPEALFEYTDAARYYLGEASHPIADRFVESVESAIDDLVTAPMRWQVVEEPEIRRYVLAGFPFVIYYRDEPQSDLVAIYAIMHCSRAPGYWHDRIKKTG